MCSLALLFIALYRYHFHFEVVLSALYWLCQSVLRTNFLRIIHAEKY